MSRSTNYQSGERHAERVLEQEGIDTLPVCPFAIASKHDIEVEPKPTKVEGVTGFLIRVADEFLICHASHLENEGFIRFTVAHELGHYFIPGHPEALFGNGDGVHESRAFGASDRHEQEADGFASALLMPRKLFVSAMRELDVGFSAIEILARRCKTSITATAIRYAKFAEDPVAVLVSVGDTIEYCFMSDAIRERDGLSWISKGTPLPMRCQTRTFNAKRSSVTDGEKSAGWSSLDDWFEGAPQIEMKEDVVGLGGYGKTLTVLFTEEAFDDEDDSSD